jgi:hypothetical protein
LAEDQEQDDAMARSMTGRSTSVDRQRDQDGRRQSNPKAIMLALAADQVVRDNESGPRNGSARRERPMSSAA